ncbi:hypothetical protein DQ04_01681050 [Trypanosoma grayi]|uniref:hypothetical protein n=1 Tax=Trypanosoma grayi TaxID=71804 RepID=UPI0004F4366D|nr:hypothetical protein DQ04_01681050 [Trypanosoma grayi]KEG12475.1 hypothetical protein DQ04_01681050 [Trypanosoma grayi]
MMPPMRVALCLLFTLYFAISPVAAQNPLMDGYDGLKRTQIDEDHPIHHLMPDPAENPELYLPLKCSACGAVVEQAVYLLRNVIARHLVRKERAARSGGQASRSERPKEYETVDALENLCRQVGQEYGVELREDGLPSLFFSRSHIVERVSGGWMPLFLASTCEELLDEREEQLISAIFSAAEEVEINEVAKRARELVCTRWERYSKGCDSRGVPIDPRPMKSADL